MIKKGKQHFRPSFLLKWHDQLRCCNIRCWKCQLGGNLIFYYVIKVVMHCFWTYERFSSLARRYDSEKHPWNDSKLYYLSRSHNVALHSRWYISQNSNSACVLNFLWYNWMIKCNACIIWMIQRPYPRRLFGFSKSEKVHRGTPGVLFKNLDIFRKVPLYFFLTKIIFLRKILLQFR